MNNKKQNIDFKSSNEMMDLIKYWGIIKKVTNKYNNEEQILNELVKELKMESPKEIIGFRLRTDYLLHISYSSNLWCAAYIMNDGCSDDMFEYFRLWLITKGEKIFTESINNPDYLINVISPGIDYYDCESFWYVALTAFEENTGKELYDYIDYSFEYGEGKYPEIEFDWNESEPETMRKICPKLMEKLWD